MTYLIKGIKVVLFTVCDPVKTQTSCQQETDTENPGRSILVANIINVLVRFLTLHLDRFNLSTRELSLVAHSD